MTPKIKNSSILVTGANGGIGLETTKLLIEEKAKRIVLACRTKEKAEAAITKLPSSSDVVLAPYGGFDMTNAASIKKAVEALPKGEKFDIVFLQSGGMVVADDFQLIETNGISIEKTIYQNVLGAYLTLRFLEQQDLVAPNARIVFPGGEGARGIPGMIKKPEFNSVDDFLSYIYNGKGKYSDIDALGVSKFMSALLLQKLALLDPNREYVWFSPGLTAGTNGLINVPNPKRFIMEKIGFPMMTLLGFAQSPSQAARKFTDCLNGDFKKIGHLIGAPEGKALGKLVDQKPMNSGLTNHQFRDAFWDLAVQACGKIKLHNN